MFGFIREKDLSFIKYELTDLREKYWKLREDHAMLLDYLAVTQVTHPAHTELKPSKEKK